MRRLNHHYAFTNNFTNIIHTKSMTKITIIPIMKWFITVPALSFYLSHSKYIPCCSVIFVERWSFKGLTKHLPLMFTEIVIEHSVSLKGYSLFFVNISFSFVISERNLVFNDLCSCLDVEFFFNIVLSLTSGKWDAENMYCSSLYYNTRNVNLMYDSSVSFQVAFGTQWLFL